MADVAEREEERKLTPQQQVFAEEYLRLWDGAKSARLAGYSAKNAREQASRLLTKANIRAYIDRRIAEIAMSADEVLLRLAQHARGTFEPFLAADGAIDLMSESAKANIGLLKKVKVKERILYPKGSDDPIKEIETEIEIHDPQSALVHMGRHYKLFTDKMEVDDTSLTDEQRVERVTRILDAARARRAGQASSGSGATGAG